MHPPRTRRTPAAHPLLAHVHSYHQGAPEASGPDGSLPPSAAPIPTRPTFFESPPESASGSASGSAGLRAGDELFVRIIGGAFCRSRPTRALNPSPACGCRATQPSPACDSFPCLPGQPLARHYRPPLPPPSAAAGARRRCSPPVLTASLTADHFFSSPECAGHAHRAPG